MASLSVLAPGMLTTVQDCGRWGWQNRGVPVAGPMDPCAHRLANALVGNDAAAATLEVTLVGPDLEFDDERTVIVTGAHFDVTVDGRAQPVSTLFTVGPGSIVRFGARRSGARAYLAVGGGIMVAPVLGSRATHLPSGMGGIDGRALRAGDRLPLGNRRPGRPGTRLPTPCEDPSAVHEARVRVLPGPHLDRFAARALDALESAPYLLDPSSNRMGFRLHGPRLAHAGDAEMLSDATTLGAVQVPRSGEPILLMADRQTTGGYPCLATVVSADIGVAGQLAPGETIAFQVTTLREAMAALIAQEQALMAIETDRAR